MPIRTACGAIPPPRSGSSSALAAVLLGSARLVGARPRRPRRQRAPARRDRVADRRARRQGPLPRAARARARPGARSRAACASPPTGRPANDTKLSTTTCAELDALAEGRRGRSSRARSAPGSSAAATARSSRWRSTYHARVLPPAGDPGRGRHRVLVAADDGGDRDSSSARRRPGRRARARAVRRGLSADARPVPLGALRRRRRVRPAPDDPRFPARRVAMRPQGRKAAPDP